MNYIWTSFRSHFFLSYNGRTGTTLDPNGLIMIVTTTFLLCAICTSILIHTFKPQGMESKLTNAKTKVDAQVLNMQNIHERMKNNLNTNIHFVGNEMHAARSKMESNLQDMSHLLAQVAVQQSKRQGFIKEMLSFAYLSRLSFAIIAFFCTSYLNALSAVIAG